MYVYDFAVLGLTTVLFTTLSDVTFSDDLFRTWVFLETEHFLKMKSQRWRNIKQASRHSSTPKNISSETPLSMDTKNQTYITHTI